MASIMQATTSAKNSNSNALYANKLKQNPNKNKNNNTNSTIKIPNKNQGIILDDIEETQIEEYIYKIGELTEPENIIYASKISHNRICIYFNDAKIAEKITDENKNIKVNNRIIQIRRLIIPTQRLVISASPTIPNYLIEQVLLSYGIKLQSTIKPLRLGLKDARFAHILGFKRHVFIIKNDEIDYPESFIIEHEETNHRVFLSGEMIKCKNCQSTDHSTNKCPTNTENVTNDATDMPQQTNTDEELIQDNPTQNINEDLNQNEHTSFPQNTPDTPQQQIPINHSNNNQPQNNIPLLLNNPLLFPPFIIPNENKTQTDPKQTTKDTQKGAKKKLSTSSGEEDTNESITLDEIEINENPEQNKEPTPNKPKTKKARSESPENVKWQTEELLSSIKHEMESQPDLYALSYDSLKEFLEKAQPHDPLSLAGKLTRDVDTLIRNLRYFHKTLQLDRSSKHRLSRLTNRLEEQLNYPASTQNSQN